MTAVRSWVQLRVGRGGHSHGITALMIGGRIAHDPKHIVERQSTTCGSCSPSLLSRTIARALLSASSFATACHSV
jgi:hypothetical protein